MVDTINLLVERIISLCRSCGNGKNLKDAISGLLSNYDIKKPIREARILM